MRYFNLPNNNSIIKPSEIVINTIKHNDICFSLVESLKKNKNKINQIIDDWDKYKKYTNSYEFIHTQIPNTKISISKYKPLSRSYFKMVEIINTFKLLNKYNNEIRTFHLAEGPGGFIEAIANMRKNKNDSYVGITLINKHSTIPNWNKCKDVMKKHKNIALEYGSDDTGDILSPDNLSYCFQKYKNSMDIITADGGFDFSSDFNNQEKLACNLIFAEICFAILTQKKGGNFIIKFFDIFTLASVDLLYILSCFYTNIAITKPCTSRTANSEKYIVCENFKFDDTSAYYDTFHNIFSWYDLKKVYIGRLLNSIIPTIYLNKIKEVNYLFGQHQIENINTTIELILTKHSSDKIDNLKKKNISRCIDWCSKNGIPYNNIVI
jgi:23S rRNA U2552 (ribose-2'-O)-methylase RlmE/FtsJ